MMTFSAVYKAFHMMREIPRGTGGKERLRYNCFNKPRNKVTN